MSRRRPPRTAAGYLAPPGAQVRGWRCPGCGQADQPAPRSWPHPCPDCGRSTEPTFEEPWAHEARGFELRRDVAGADEYRRAYAETALRALTYLDARRRGDEPAAAAAWQAARDDMRRAGPDRSPWELVRAAAQCDDLDRAIDLLLEWYPTIDASAVAEDSSRRATARNFVSLCIAVLEREASIGRAGEAALDRAMREMHDRHEDIPTYQHRPGFQRVGEIRARRRTQDAISRARRSGRNVALPPLSVGRGRPGRSPRPAEEAAHAIVGPFGLNRWRAMALADASTEAAQTQGDTGPLDALITRLDSAGGFPVLTALVRTRRCLVDGDLPGAIRVLEQASGAGLDPLQRWLSPQLWATLGLLRARHDPAALDQGIELCRRGRRSGRGRVTPADTALATLLLRRAARPDTTPAQGAGDIREAARLTRRRGGWWHVRDIDDLIARHDARAALDKLTGRTDLDRTHRAWRKSLNQRWQWSTTERARLAQAWAEWAAGTEVAAFAAEAYYYLVDLAAQDAVSRHRETARQHALAGAQEYAEEAGYWLARTGNYREAVLALETGRAVGLTRMLGSVSDRLRATGRLADYDDVIEQTDDGALLYLAAATAGGYALIVSAHHDPQFVDLPRLDRAAVLTVADAMLPGASTLAGVRSPVQRDADIAGPAGNSTAAGLRTLWTDGLRDLLLFRARGRIVSLVPVGLLSLLPLHAAGEPGLPDDQHSEWRHAGGFTAVRYAPNARALQACRRTARAAELTGQSLLAVDAALGPGTQFALRLRHVARETEEVARRWGGPTPTTVHDCTWARFQELAGRHTVWHVACHATADPNSIMDSRLLFSDRAVTVEELRRTLPAGTRRLAVLSACQTNVTGTAMPNEMVGLPSAFLEIGFAGVIASAWPVDDLATAYLMTALYHWWRQDSHEPVVALNWAQRWLRTATRADLVATLPGIEPEGDRGSDRPYADARYWAPFAYTGV